MNTYGHIGIDGHNIFGLTVVNNGEHTYTEQRDGLWKHNSPWGGGNTYAQPSRLITDEKYVLVKLQEAGTQDRGCQRSGLINLARAEKEAQEFIELNPGGEAIIMKAHKSYKGQRKTVVVVEQHN